jgi:hypothetical protein
MNMWAQLFWNRLWYPTGQCVINTVHPRYMGTEELAPILVQCKVAMHDLPYFCKLWNAFILLNKAAESVESKIFYMYCLLKYIRNTCNRKPGCKPNLWECYHYPKSLLWLQMTLLNIILLGSSLYKLKLNLLHFITAYEIILTNL